MKAAGNRARRNRNSDDIIRIASNPVWKIAPIRKGFDRRKFDPSGHDPAATGEGRARRERILSLPTRNFVAVRQI
jgi:hypothetical protein